MLIVTKKKEKGKAKEGKAAITWVDAMNRCIPDALDTSVADPGERPGGPDPPPPSSLFLDQTEG